jgi:hypothetical protein
MIDTAILGIFCIAGLLWEIGHTTREKRRWLSRNFLLINAGLSATLTIIFKYMAGMPSESSAFYEMASGIFLYMAFIEMLAAAVIQAGICDLSMETYFISGKILLALIIPELKTLWIILCPSLAAWYIILDQTARTLFESISNKIWQ